MIFLLACSEYVVNQEVKRDPVQQPPVPAEDYEGQPPNWGACGQGFSGVYFNHDASHMDFGIEEEEETEEDPSNLDWWDASYRSFERYDASLDFGEFWYPVNEGFQGDPDFFAVRWNAWLRVYENNQTISFVVGAANDFWLQTPEEVLFYRAGLHDFELDVVDVSIARGQYPITILYAHRAGNSGLSFRLVSDNAQLCFPDWDE